MDKKLNRTIGYRPDKNGVNASPGTAKTKASVHKKSPVTAKEVCNWLKSHEYLSISPLCKAAGLDPGNFHRTMASENPVIKPEIIDKLVNILGQYGFLKK